MTEAPKKAAKKAATHLDGESGTDWQEEYPGEEVFVFTTESGATVGMAKMAGNRRLLPGEFRQIMQEPRNLRDMVMMFRTLEKVSSPAALAISDVLEDAEYADMYQQWLKWQQTTPGES